MKATIADWNNNGAADLWIQKPSGDTIQYVTFTPEFMNSVSNGLGITTTVTYDRINKPAVYTKDTNATYPTVDINGPFYVVARVDSGNGVGGTYSSTYTYAGLKADQAGRGFLGFRQRTITDLQTNVVETTTFRQDFPYLGLVSSQTKVRGAVTLNSKANTFASSSPAGRYSASARQWSSTTLPRKTMQRERPTSWTRRSVMSNVSSTFPMGSAQSEPEARIRRTWMRSAIGALSPSPGGCTGRGSRQAPACPPYRQAAARAEGLRCTAR